MDDRREFFDRRDRPLGDMHRWDGGGGGGGGGGVVSQSRWRACAAC